MRTQRNAEEKKRLNDLRKEQDGKRKLAEIREKRKAELKKQGSSVAISSYDPHGNLVELQTLQKFPSMNPKCAASSKLIESGPLEKELSMAQGGNLLRKLSELPDNRLIEELRTQPPRIIGLTENIEIKPAKNVYDSFAPVAGVTFTEKGRDPKAASVSIAEQKGKLTKTGFYSSLVDASLRIAASLPSLLPNINNKPKQLIQGASSSKNITITNIIFIRNNDRH